MKLVMENENRLIRVGKAVHDMCNACSVAAPGIAFKPKHCSLVDALRNIPAVDAVEVVHGAWEPECKNRSRCSRCGIGRNIETQIGWNYCPNCGAKMDLPRITDKTQAALARMGEKAHGEEKSC